MSADIWYIDSSALVKTVLLERESGDLELWLRGRDLAVCDLARVEVVRAVRLSDRRAVERAREVLATLTLIELGDSVYEQAADLGPARLRSLDAIHLAAARSLGFDLAGVVTYDRRMAEGAESLGLRVLAPGRDS